MRLSKVAQGHRGLDAVRVRAIGLMFRREPTDVVKTLLYRSAFFGKPMSRVFQTVMRGRSSWSIGQRELFAAFVSRQNSCDF